MHKRKRTAGSAWLVGLLAMVLWLARVPMAVNAEGIQIEKKEQERTECLQGQDGSEKKPSQSEQEKSKPQEGDFQWEDGPPMEEAPFPMEEDVLPLESGNEAENAEDSAVGAAEHVVSSGGVEEPEEILHQPRLILQSSNLSDTFLEAGKELALEVSFQNKSRERSIYNLKISVGCETAGIRPSQTSFYYEKIAPGGTISLQLLLTASPSVEQSSFPVEFSMEYEDDKGTALTGREQLSLEVRQPVKVELTGFHMADKVYAADTISQEIQVQNAGRASLCNVQIDVEGPGIFTMEEAFLGNLESGAVGNGQLKLYIGTKNSTEPGVIPEGSEKEKYGQTEGILRLTYEDAFGNTYTQEESFTTNIVKAKVLELKVEKETEATNGWWISLVVLIGVVLTAAVCLLSFGLIQSRRRLKDAMIIREELYGKRT